MVKLGSVLSLSSELGECLSRRDPASEIFPVSDIPGENLCQEE